MSRRYNCLAERGLSAVDSQVEPLPHRVNVCAVLNALVLDASVRELVEDTAPFGLT